MLREKFPEFCGSPSPPVGGAGPPPPSPRPKGRRPGLRPGAGLSTAAPRPSCRLAPGPARLCRLHSRVFGSPVLSRERRSRDVFTSPRLCPPVLLARAW